MNIYTRKGAKVKYTGIGGYDREKVSANKYLKIGETYTVSGINVGKWHSAVYLEEFPGETFNSVQFRNIE